MSIRPEPPGNDDPVEALLARLSVSALATNTVRADELAGLIREAARRGWPEDRRTSAAEIAHQIVGSAGTFGYPRVSAVAEELEDLLRDRRLVNGEFTERAHRLLEVLQQELAEARAPSSG